jgi:MFS family permease
VFAWCAAVTPDGWLLFLTNGIRNLAYGFLAVILALYLAELGLNITAIGAIFTVALAGAAATTLLLTTMADRVGRRRVLIIGAGLMALAGAAFALTDNIVLLAIAAVVGTISPSGKDVGPFLSVEQAMLPQTTPDTPDAHRTDVFAAYNIVNSFAAAAGALVAVIPNLLGLPLLEGYRALIWVYAAIGVVLLVLFARLSPEVEVITAPRKPGFALLGVEQSRSTVAKLATLFALDAFAGGFVIQSFLALWFHLRYGADLAALGGIFFGTNFLAALSFFAAPAIARRIGLLKTMVLTHLPSNVLLLFVPLAPTLEIATAMLLVRFSIAQMDVPTRQSYTMAIIPAEERAAASGLLAVSRSTASALAPVFAGATLANPALGLPFFVAGSFKIVYDLAIFAVFRNVHPPEESARRAVAPAAQN